MPDDQTDGAVEANAYPEGGQFTGVIGRTLDESVPAWPKPVRAPSGSPNVVVVLLDDVGFAQLGCYGADIRTPTFDRLAAVGLRYRQFHTTTLCSPSRACLLTGRNHHANATGMIMEMARGFPGYHTHIPRANGFLSEILRDCGYATFAIGKWHLTPETEWAPGSPKTRWPLGRGFDRFYGFLDGRTSQYAPDLVYDNHPIAPPRTPEEGYHLNEDMADRAIEFISDLRAVDPDKPFALYYCPGAGHHPHHVPREWADRYAGQFDQGWDRWREDVLARQLDIGIVPTGTSLSDRPEWIAAWDTLSEEQRRLYARQMEVYAGFLEHTDHHIGRLVGFLAQIGELDNTVIVVASDNGTDGSGGPHGNNGYGHFPELSSLAGNLRLLDEWGGPETYPQYSWGWAWAGNTPLRRWKHMLHEGGISDPLIVSWPAGIAARGEVRDQYAHIIDITPTILDTLSIDPPDEIAGVTQAPMHGVSFAHTFDDPDAASRKSVQYYEMHGSRAIWAAGWKAVTELEPGSTLTAKELTQQEWELYRIGDDFSECRDLADQYPEKLQELIDLWWHEAGRYDVLPLGPEFRPSEGRHTTKRSRYVYYPNLAPLPTPVAVDVVNQSHRITAHLEIPDDGAEGVLLAHGGGNSGGYTLYVREQRLTYVYNYAGLHEHRLVAGSQLPTGKLTVGLQFTKTADRRATATLTIDGRAQGEVQIPKTVPMLPRSRLSCGYHRGPPITTEYQTPFRFTGTVKQVDVELTDS